MSKRLLILTGPQGSGNHLWSKIFSESPQVHGWTQLTKEYWVGHGDEPFSDIWEDPLIFHDHKWNDGYYYTSISCPYIIKGGPEMNQDGGGRTPKYDEFISTAQSVGFDVTIGVLGRDVNILEYQQSRIRKTITVPKFLEAFDNFIEKYNPEFLSTELLYLYKHRYLKTLEEKLNFPIDISEEKLNDILKDNANAKYVKPIDHYWLDDHMKQTATTHGLINNPYKYKKIKDV
jgi:hypothetical protein